MPMIAFWLAGLTLFGCGWVYPWMTTRRDDARDVASKGADDHVAH